MVLVTYTFYQLQPSSHSAANYPPETETRLCQRLLARGMKHQTQPGNSEALHDLAAAWPFISICQLLKLTLVLTPSAASAKHSSSGSFCVLNVLSLSFLAQQTPNHLPRQPSLVHVCPPLALLLPSLIFKYMLFVPLCAAADNNNGNFC